MPLTSAQQTALSAALDRLQNFYDGDNPYNPATYPGAFRQGGSVINFPPALKDVATVMNLASILVSDATAAAASSPKALRVDSAQSFTDTEVGQAITNLKYALRADAAQSLTAVQRRRARANIGASGAGYTGSLGGATVLTASALGQTFYLNGTTNYIVDLPAMGAGDRITFFNANSTPKTIRNTASLYFGAGTAGIYTVKPYSKLVIEGYDDATSGCFVLDAAPMESALNADIVQSFSTIQQAQLASNLGLVMPAAFQCRLTVSSTTQMALVPAIGLNIFINGKIRQIPVAGVTLGIGSLAANTLYYVYAQWTGSAVALVASSTAPVTDSTYGHKVATGDPTMTLVGMVYPVSIGSGLQFADFGQYRCVASYYHRQRKDLSVANSSGSTGTTLTEFGARCYFLSWGEEATDIGVIGTAFPSAYDNVLYNLDVDGGAISYPQSGPAVDANHGMNISQYIPATYAMGAHYFRLMARSGGSSISLTHQKVGAVTL
ncbi:hypothetical protein [Methylobacterium longum]|uniref:Tail fiber protein n=1 Tax=Methylobacterium longum TaxID=767694 RepID=A0ABT8APW6_9HYPH|nr:hypothetical protein [Methylobacterium longum]MDN3571800.1 hypothetical protein [Methylobacterium longum]GJE14001.1 hypothetical protein FOHLNKBM_5070 [Methylobacterium longum]